MGATHRRRSGIGSPFRERPAQDRHRDRIDGLDAIEMARIARGIDQSQLLREPSLFTNVNANSPRQFDVPMLWGMI